MPADIVIAATSTQARCFRREAWDEPLVPLPTLQADLSGLAEHAPPRLCPPSRLDPRRKRHLLFAQQLAEHIDGLLSQEHDPRLLLFAACPFLGEARQQLGPQARRALVLGLDLDLSHCGLDELESRVRQAEAQDAHRPHGGADARP